MKNALKAITLVGVLLSLTSYANPILKRNAQLKASNGTEILIEWGFTGDNGMDGYVKSDSLTVTLENGSPELGLQVVSVTDCGPSYGKSVAKCGLAFTGNGNEQQCVIGTLPIAYLWEGSVQATCSQQFAFVMQDGSWLVDPVNGSHNFNVSLK